MKKIILSWLLAVVLFTSTASAFTNGSAAATTPWSAPVPGALFVSFNVGAPLNMSIQAININGQIDLTTLAIGPINLSASYAAVGQTITVTYLLSNTGTTPINNVDATLSFYTPATGNVDSHFTVTKVAPAANFALAAGASQLVTLQVTPTVGRPLGRVIVDGRVVSSVPSALDWYWSNGKIQSAFVFTGSTQAAYLYNQLATLNITTPVITAPAGAVDKVFSTGQAFTVSANVWRQGESLIGGLQQVQIALPAALAAPVANQTFALGSPVAFNVTALNNPGIYIVTVSIVDTGSTALTSPIDQTSGLEVKYGIKQATMSVRVVAPALIRVNKVLVPTNSILPNNATLIQAQVGLTNLGGATANIVPAAGNLDFTLNGSAIAYGVPTVPGVTQINPGQTLTINYQFRTLTFANTGRCTINATISSTDLNSGATLVTQSAVTRRDWFWVKNTTANLRIGNQRISSPNGATDGTVSVGQSFWTSCNVVNIGGNPVGGTLQVNLTVPAFLNAGGVTTKIFTLNTPITFNISAIAAGSGFVTLSITSTPAIHPTDAVMGVTASYAVQTVTVPITVQAPAALDVQLVQIASKNVHAFGVVPVNVAVRVRNTGTAQATVNLTSSDLTFTVGGVNQTASYIYTPIAPLASVLNGGAVNTFNYTITMIGGGTGAATASATIHGLDRNNGAALSNTATGPESATYNVLYDAGLAAGAIRISANPLKRQASFQVFVPISAFANVRVQPQLTDLFISQNPAGSNVANVSFNVTAVNPSGIFTMSTGQTRSLTYNVTILSTAVAGTYTINVRPGFPSANYQSNSQPAADPDAGTPTTNVVYDSVSPNLVMATPNLSAIALRITQPTTNFYIDLLFSETMNVSYLPALTFQMQAGGAPSYATGTWSLANHRFRTNAMTLSAANAGWVTVNMTGGARDIAGNTVVPSPSFLHIFVDPIAPIARVTINNGQALTTNPQVRVAIGGSDNHSAINTMQMWIYGSPISGVSINQTISLNMWIPYQALVTINLDNTSFASKNIVVRLRDQAGNISTQVTDDIFLDTDSLVWQNPTANNFVSTNIRLRIATSTKAQSVKFLVSVNHVLTPIVSNIAVNPVTGLASFLWTTANIYPATTQNAQLIAVVRKSGYDVTGNLYPVHFDNAPPRVTINIPSDPSYVWGAVTVSGVASDPRLTSITRVQLSFDNGVTFPITATGTANWTYSWNVPAVVDMTTFNVVARATDRLGLVANSTVTRLVKYSALPVITLKIPPTPTTNLYLRNTFRFHGRASSLLPIGTVRVALGTLTSNVVAVGTANWGVTFNIPVAMLKAQTLANPAVLLSVTAITNTVPALMSTTNFNYRVDGATPNLSVTNLINGMGAIGTFNVTGTFTDVGSGLSALEVSVNGGTWQSLTHVGGVFSYSFGINAASQRISFRAVDSAYPTGNMSNVFTYLITRNYALLPTGRFSNPVSGSYVNNTMTIIGTANVHDSPTSTVSRVWVNFGQGWVTATITSTLGTGANWRVSWLVPTIDAHGTIYQAQIRVLSSKGVMAAVSPSVQAQYEKDKYGAQCAILNMYNGMYIPQTNSTFLTVFKTYTEGALVSNSYLVVDGIAHPVVALIAQNTTWNYAIDLYSLQGTVHTAYVRAVDRVGNITTSNTITFRFVGGQVATEPLPPGGMVPVTTNINSPVYATSLNYVWFTNVTPADIQGVYVDGTLRPYLVSGADIRVTLSALASIQERVYVVAVLTSDGSLTTINYQPIMYDVTRPTINVVFNGVHRYYPTGYIAPNEIFAINVIDRTASGTGYGSGFGFTPSFNAVTTNAAYRLPGTIQSSVYNAAGLAQTQAGFAFDPYTELFQFRVNLARGTYQLSLDAIDNAGNPAIVSFNVPNLIVDADATGEAGGIDTDRFYSAYPNPYDPNNDDDIFFTYYLKDNARRSRIFIYNEVGQLVEVLEINGVAQEGTRAGYNAVPWDARDKFSRLLSNGVYLFMVVVEGDKDQTFVKGKFAVLRR